MFGSDFFGVSIANSLLFFGALIANCEVSFFRLFIYFNALANVSRCFMFGYCIGIELFFFRFGSTCKSSFCFRFLFGLANVLLWLFTFFSFVSFSSCSLKIFNAWLAGTNLLKSVSISGSLLLPLLSSSSSILINICSPKLSLFGMSRIKPCFVSSRFFEKSTLLLSSSNFTSFLTFTLIFSLSCWSTSIISTSSSTGAICIVLSFLSTSINTISSSSSLIIITLVLEFIPSMFSFFIIGGIIFWLLNSSLGVGSLEV